MPAKEVLPNSGLALVDFWASWCTLSEMTGVLIEECAERCKARLQTIRINVDDEPGLGAHFHVSVIPTLILLDEGQTVARFVGSVSRDDLMEAIDRHAVGKVGKEGAEAVSGLACSGTL